MCHFQGHNINKRKLNNYSLVSYSITNTRANFEIVNFVHITQIYFKLDIIFNDSIKRKPTSVNSLKF